MKITEREMNWLESRFPNLQYDADTQKIIGELDFCAAYDAESGKLTAGDSAINLERFICDVFEIEIRLGTLDTNGWPRVYEVGGRHRQIAKKCNVEITDLHFNSDDDSCCLGLKFPSKTSLGIRVFLLEWVIPFFYRLSYTEAFGIVASRNDLWGEYSHGEEGKWEYLSEISKLAKLNLGRNSLCPCESGKKYKNCHLDDVESYKRQFGQ